MNDTATDFRSEDHSSSVPRPRMLFIRLISVCACIVGWAIFPLIKAGKSDAAALLVPIFLLLFIGFLIEWVRPSRNGSSITRRLLRLLFAVTSVSVLVAIYWAVFGTPSRITRIYQYVIEKLVYLINRFELVIHLNDLVPRNVWTWTIGALFGVLLLALVLWNVRLKISRLRLFFFCALLFLGFILGIFAPSREFQISSSVNAAQFALSVAPDPSGDFVAVWQSKDQDGSGWGIYARRFYADGTPKAAEFQVNTYTPENQFVPRIGMDNSGNFAITWESKGQDGSSYGVYCQRYDSDGIALGENFQVNTHTAESQHDPFIAMTPRGEFVIVWVSDKQDGDLAGIFGQRFDALGNRLGDEFPINTFTSGDQKQPSISSDDDGNFAVAWESEGQDGSGRGIFVRRFNAAGVPFGNEFQANTYTNDNQTDAWISMSPSGRFVVAWSSNGEDGSGTGIYGRRFDALGSPIGDEFQINTFTAGDQIRPAVSSDVDGDFVVVWESDGEDGSGKGVYGRSFDANGNALTGEFRLNVYTTNDQFGAFVAHTAQNRLIAFWTSFGEDGSTEGAYGRIYSNARTPNW